MNGIGSERASEVYNFANSECFSESEEAFLSQVSPLIEKSKEILPEYDIEGGGSWVIWHQIARKNHKSEWCDLLDQFATEMLKK